MQTSDYLDVLFVSGPLSVITKTTRVTDHTFSVTGCIHANKPEKVIKLGLTGRHSGLFLVLFSFSLEWLVEELLA